MNQIDINFGEIVKIVETRRKNAFQKVNEETIKMYWEFGEYVSNKVVNSQWGEKIVTKLAEFMQKNYPTLKGFNKRGLYRMKQFYETYKDYPEFVTTLLTQINWSSHIALLSKTKTIKQKEFYIKLAIKENYSTRELTRQIDSSYFERYILSDGKALISNSKLINEEKIPNTRLLDTYTLEFLNLREGYSEKDLRRAIIKNMKDFILEIGKDFSFVGEEYRVQVGNHDFYIDLLFYNRDLKCLIAFELKIGEFMPEYISKMDFYLEILDRQLKKEYENPSVGVILCSNKDDEVVEYAMSRSMSPTLVSEYKLKLIDKKILENKLKEISDIVEENNNNKYLQKSRRIKTTKDRILKENSTK